MDIFDYGKAFADYWALGGKALLQAQEGMNRVLTDRVKAMASGELPTLPTAGVDTAELTRATDAMAGLWTAAASLSGTLAAHLPQTEGDQTVEATFRKMVDPRTWLAGGGEVDEVLTRMAEGPRLADLWDVERRYASVAKAWLELRRRSLEHQAVVLEAWLRAGQRFSDETAGSSGKGKPDGKALLAQWTETANQELLETQRSDSFLSTQTALIRASTALKIAQRDLLEYYGEQLGFPTRTELDDVHRTVTELRREVRALRRQLRPAAQPAPAAPPDPAPRADAAPVAAPVKAAPVKAAKSARKG